MSVMSLVMSSGSSSALKSGVDGLLPQNIYTLHYINTHTHIYIKKLYDWNWKSNIEGVKTARTLMFYPRDTKSVCTEAEKLLHPINKSFKYTSNRKIY